MQPSERRVRLCSNGATHHNTNVREGVGHTNLPPPVTTMLPVPVCPLLPWLLSCTCPFGAAYILPITTRIIVVRTTLALLECTRSYHPLFVLLC